MSKTLIVDFYQVKVLEPHTLSFNDILKQVEGITLGKRVIEVRYRHIYLYEIKYGWQDTWEGEIVRLRMDELPIKASLSGKIEEFPLAADEGVGEQSAFIYHPLTGIIALQANGHGVSPGDFARYFSSLLGQGITISLVPVIQMDALKKVASLQQISRFDVNIASISNPGALFGKTDKGVEEIINLAETFQAPSIHLEIKTSLKKNQPTLSLKSVKDAVQTLFRLHHTPHNKISTLKVVGVDDEDNMVAINLLKDKMRENIAVNNPTKNRNLPYSVRQSTLQKAWNNRINEILKMFN